MKDLLIMSPAPEIISAEFNSDLTKMLINFNENIEAENSQCDSLFDAETIKLIGEGKIKISVGARMARGVRLCS